MAIMQSLLPYERDALEPFVSEKTMTFHYDKHHRGYIDKLNKLIEGTEYADLKLEQIIVKARKEARIDILNNAAQAWNHSFFWNSMSPKGGSPDGKIKDLIDDQFEDLEAFKKRLRDEAASVFGSGWAWLVLDNGKLRVISTSNAETPVGTHLLPLLNVDVWEHAYYLDYQNRRPEFIDAFVDNLINWNFVEANLEQAEMGKAA